MTEHKIVDVIGTRKVKIVSVNLPVRVARDLLQEPELDALLVLSEMGPCGVLRQTTLDMCEHVTPQTPVGTVMALAGPAVPGTMDAMQALRVMRACERNDLPVMDEAGYVVSLLSVTDLMMVLDLETCEELVA